MNDPRLWSNRRFFAYALVLSALYALARLAGLEAHTSVLAGVNAGGYAAQYFGLVHLLLYVAFVLVVPVLVIAGGLLELGGRLARATPPDPQDPSGDSA